MAHKIEDLVRSGTQQSVPDGGWVPALPGPWFGWRGVRDRCADAFAVLTGKAAAVTWPQHRKNTTPQGA